MIIDTSALVAIFLDESDADRLLRSIAGDNAPKVSAATVVEAGIVLSLRKSRPMQHALELFLEKLRIEVIPLTREHSSAAIRAWWKFGRTRSPAKLNFGDCLSYATAEIEGEPLLCLGGDFVQTDLPLVKLPDTTGA